MIRVRRNHERGHANHGWLKTYHTFSFADYYDPQHMGYRSLRVMNEDVVAPGQGFPSHGHRDMEIVTYIISGVLEHKDNIGTGSAILPGDVQRMTAGTGVFHSEFNASAKEPVHLLQIWILPEKTGLTPRYEQKVFPKEGRLNQLRLIASRPGRDGSIAIHQDVDIYASLLQPGKRVELPVSAGRYLWVQVARGVVTANGERLAAGDGAAIEEITMLELAAVEDAELLVFDLA